MKTTKTKIRRKSLKPLPKLKAEAEKWCHWYVRLRDCQKTTGTLHHGLCFTCGKDTPIKEFQAGHFRHGKLDFDEDNLNGQCIRCNHFLSGDLGNYAIRLIREHSQEWMDDLILRSHTEPKRCRSDYEELIQKFKEKVSQLTSSKELPFL